MKSVLFLHGEIKFYKIPIYNKLSEALREKGYHIVFWPLGIQQEGEGVEFSYISDKKMTPLNYKKVLSNYNIDIIINHLNKSDPGYLFYLSTIFFAKLKGKEVYFYGHGVKMSTKRKVETTILNILYLFFDKLILYSPDEKKYLWPSHRKKTSVAYNTLDMEGRGDSIKVTRSSLKEKMGYEEENLVLFSGRIRERKKLGVLVDVFKSNFIHDDVRLLIVGPSLSSSYKKEIKKINNITYLGPIYDRKEISKIFYISDLFCIPGWLGLAVVEAFYWGLPVLSLETKNAPEQYYLEEEYNSFIAENKTELSEKIKLLLRDKDLRKKMSSNAYRTYKSEATLDRMFEGFFKVLP